MNGFSVSKKKFLLEIRLNFINEDKKNLAQRKTKQSYCMNCIFTDSIS